MIEYAFYIPSLDQSKLDLRDNPTFQQAVNDFIDFVVTTNGGATVIEATGVWFSATQRVSEPVRIIQSLGTVDAHDKLVQRFATLKELGNQEAMLYTQRPVTANFI